MSEYHPQDIPDSSQLTIQDYIDQTPAWPDGTPCRSVPLTRMQQRIWLLASAGKFFEGLVVFMTGVALPLIMQEFDLGATGKGALGAATLFGILIGATSLGSLSDRYGRKRMFIIEMAIFTTFLALMVVSPSYPATLLFLFGMGLALGCDYPTAHVVISESIPSCCRGRLVISAFAFQAVGALAGTAIGYMILREAPDVGAWRLMYATAIAPALAVLVGRFFIPESGQWLFLQGQKRDAEQQTLRLLDRTPPYPTQLHLATQTDEETDSSGPSSYRELFASGNRRALILAAVPWFLQDLGTYGIGIFTPTILSTAIGAKVHHPHSLAAVIHNDMLASQGAAFVDLLLIVGIVVAVLLVDRIGRIRLQFVGFLGCAAGLLLASFSLQASGITSMVFLYGGFMLFNFMTNLGPNATTYLLAGEVFPTRIRGKGAGFAASFAKIGAVLTAFLFPILLKDIGTQTLLSILVGTSLLGAFVTRQFGIETTGLNLDRLDNA